MTININKVQTGMLNEKQAIEETNSVLYATEIIISDFGFF